MAGTGRRFIGLDGLRAVGALAVLTTHVGFSSGASLFGPFAGFLARLDSGVAVFFVISGFLLYRPRVLARLDGGAVPEVRPYLWHRALRILPVVWIAVLLAATLIPHAAGIGWAPFLRVATLTQIYWPDQQLAGLSQMWSLSTEVVFYLLLPFLARGLARVGGTTRRSFRRELVCLAGLGAVSVGWWVVVTNTSAAQLGLWLPGYLGWFAVGMALATWSVAREKGLIERGPLDSLAGVPGTAWSAAAALFVVATTPIAGPLGLDLPTTGTAITKNLLYALIALLVVLPLVAHHSGAESPVVRHLGSGVPRYLGQISYGVFAYHVTLLAVVERMIGHRSFTGDFARMWLATAALSVVVASMSYYWVERPILRWGRRHEPGAAGKTARANAPSTNA